jgi:transketolase
MRKQFVKSVEDKLLNDPNLVLLLGDIGVFGFQKDFQAYPDRVYNIGILEQATVGIASGLAKVGLVPVVHTIAPFLVERSYEQLKIDFGYQRLGGNFVSVGASYDYASLGCTHHCPGDIGILLSIPHMEITIPGTAEEFDTLFAHAYANGHATYYRLSERENDDSQAVSFGKLNVLKQGASATVLAIGPTLDMVSQATVDLDVTVLYCTTVAPFDVQTFKDHVGDGSKVLVVEPFYTGTMAHTITQAAGRRPIRLESIGVQREFLTKYGHAEDHDKANGLTVENIRVQLLELIHE